MRTSVRTVERAWLEQRLGEGRSIESLAKEVGRHPSTVAYWVNRHGLASAHAARHAPRGGIPRETLESLVEQGLSSRRIATELGVSQATVNHWLKRHGLKTERARSGDARESQVLRTCAHHGRAVFVRYGEADHYRCLR